MSSDLTLLFERLERWLSAHAPQIYSELTPGAQDSELDELEALTGQTLPPDYRELYCRHGDWGKALLLTHLPLLGVQREWLMWESLAGEDFASSPEGHSSFPLDAITPRYINLGWIPFLTDYGGNSVGIDLAPASAGVRGQVITFGRDEREKYVLAPSLHDFLREYVERLEAGRGRVIDENDLDFPPFQPFQRLELTNAAGEGVDEYLRLADLFPGFGAVPNR
ncbi:hypothetical protein D3875_17320 [Deinococcus cavernae]|uniref:Knr4/Smi1-like domain-containing protein n=1 Tax=Deinococcus cavernae TaxID=2320857 RepID=A0A418VA94_9DEIO|nr:SMI1/KNR4 family protein [Deinococcus cavernae]RJF73041.1 hypothetical protein D3875_17320 [Deinococcus cavernae]